MRKWVFIILLFFTAIINADNLKLQNVILSKTNRALAEKVYQHACSNCHAPKVAKGLNAPPAFDVEAWKVRFNHAKEQAAQNPNRYKSPYDYLVQQIKIGKGLMHHGGLCLESKLSKEECSENAYIQVIKYMSEPNPTTTQ